jgi:hypothetical protein
VGSSGGVGAGTTGTSTTLGGTTATRNGQTGATPGSNLGTGPVGPPPDGIGSTTSTGPAPNQSSATTTPMPAGHDSPNPTGPQPQQSRSGAGTETNSRLGQIAPSPGLNAQGSSTSGLTTGGSARSIAEANYQNCIKSWDGDTHMTKSEYAAVCWRLRRGDESVRQAR